MTFDQILLLILCPLLAFLAAFAGARLAQGGRERDARATDQRTGEQLRSLEERLRADAAQSRQETQQALLGFRDSIASAMMRISEQNSQQMQGVLKQQNLAAGQMEERMERMRQTMDRQLVQLRQDNAQQLERMRVTVDEKLHQTLETRLGESFKQVSAQLEQVYKGLGEMQSLAEGVGDLKKVLTNVKTRGTFGEVSLGMLLEQVLAPGQYATNVAVKPGAAERVEFAVQLPGGQDGEGPLWLPIDAKFPQEDYQRMLDAQDPAQMELAGRQLEARLKTEAKRIRDKYIAPPHTTDFAIMYLPVEGLYAEALRRPGLWENLQREMRVTICGPTTIAAFLNSLQMGFKTLAIQQRSSEVWALLGVVKTEFGKFGEVLAKTQKKLQEAANTIEAAQRRSRVIARKLKDVQELPAADDPLGLGAAQEEDEDGDSFPS